MASSGAAHLHGTPGPPGGRVAHRVEKDRRRRGPTPVPFGLVLLSQDHSRSQGIWRCRPLVPVRTQLRGTAHPRLRRVTDALRNWEGGGRDCFSTPQPRAPPRKQGGGPVNLTNRRVTGAYPAVFLRPLSTKIQLGQGLAASSHAQGRLQYFVATIRDATRSRGSCPGKHQAGISCGRQQLMILNPRPNNTGAAFPPGGWGGSASSLRASVEPVPAEGPGRERTALWGVPVPAAAGLTRPPEGARAPDVAAPGRSGAPAVRARPGVP
ncbi:hypothetical protein NDU88_005570 [Pleurodeles waltl]|uniref:Uncharacterized protein n=1 Tax=Pleurodeles waltl TaxID=8319 RepID=A0AAV7LLJ8_PLEWA|nr:hypothetical protein NDU88_005570 [Pleurodeles waltl]